MRHLKKGKKLNRGSAARIALIKSLATNLILYEKIKTTQAKAKFARPYVEKIITVGKNNTLANRRLLLQKLYLKKAVNKVFDVLSPRFKNNKGGYTRITKLGPRQGDGAEMAQIEFINLTPAPAPEKSKK